MKNLDTGVLVSIGRELLFKSGKEKTEWREDKVRHLKEEIKNRKLRQETMAKQNSQLKKCESEYKMGVEFLHFAVSALKGLAAVMGKAVLVILDTAGGTWQMRGSRFGGKKIENLDIKGLQEGCYHQVGQLRI